MSNGSNAANPGNRKDPFPAYYFKVEIKKAGFSGTAFFRSCSGLKSESEVMTIDEGGVNTHQHKLIGRTKYPNLVLKQGFADGTFCRLREDVAIREEVAGRKARFSGSICQMGPGGKEHKWTFENGWICKWEGPDLDATKNEISMETIEIAHNGFRQES